MFSKQPPGEYIFLLFKVILKEQKKVKTLYKIHKFRIQPHGDAYFCHLQPIFWGGGGYTRDFTVGCKLECFRRPAESSLDSAVLHSSEYRDPLWSDLRTGIVRNVQTATEKISQADVFRRMGLSSNEKTHSGTYIWHTEGLNGYQKSSILLFFVLYVLHTFFESQFCSVLV